MDHYYGSDVLVSPIWLTEAKIRAIIAQFLRYYYEESPFQSLESSETGYSAKKYKRTARIRSKREQRWLRMNDLTLSFAPPPDAEAQWRDFERLVQTEARAFFDGD